MNKIVLSPLAHTWILDLDGTIVKHNGYKIDGKDTILKDAKEFLNSIPLEDMIIFITSRKDDFKEETIHFLNENNIRFNHIIFNAPYGERILINDNKPSGLEMGKVINQKRDSFISTKIVIDKEI